jgi:drug/metabolite transporter (DMT)-like permease
LERSFEGPHQGHDHAFSKQAWHYILAISYSVLASLLWGVHNLTLKYLIHKENIRPREYSYISTLIDGLLGTLGFLYFCFVDIAMVDADGEGIPVTHLLHDTWVMLMAGALSGVAVLIGLIGVSIGKLGTSQVLLNSYALVQILLEILIQGQWPSQWQSLTMCLCLTGGGLIIAFENHVDDVSKA